MISKSLSIIAVLGLVLNSSTWATPRKPVVPKKGVQCVESVLESDQGLSGRADPAQLWSLSRSKKQQDDIGYVLGRQDELNATLIAQEEKTIETGQVPGPRGASPKGLSTYVEGLPASVKQDFVLRYLQKNGTSSQAVTEIISRLEPTEGVRDAVTKFLSQSPFLDGSGNQAAFTKEQVRQMFTPKRFQEFFPWVAKKEINLVVAPETKLLVAVKTSPLIATENGLDPALLGVGAVDRRHYETEVPRTAVRQVLHYDPVVLPRVLKDQMDADFHLEGLTPEEQIHGLVVQGHYEKDGNSLYVDFSAKRGVADIESDVPKINRALKVSLENGTLRQQKPIVRRLFAYNWAMNSNSNLIASLRQTALRVAEVDPGFTPLRIEIHAFPTRDLYDRVVAYIAKYRARTNPKPNPKALALMDQCTAEMEGVLGIGKNARGLDTVISELNGPKALITQMQAESASFEQLPLQDRLEHLAKVRDGWKEKRLGEGSAVTGPVQANQFDYFTGDRELSGLSMRLEKELIDKLPKDPEAQLTYVDRLSRQILGQVRQDDFLDEGQVKTIEDQLNTIVKDKSMTVERRLELVSDLLNNSVDQVYYGLKRPFGELDERILRMAAHGKETTPVRFLDGTLRSNNVFMLSQLVDAMEEAALARKNISHLIGDTKTRIPARVFNPGQAVGVLRINKNPMELTSSEIGVMSEMPTESGAVGGIVTLGVGARLSHLQLLARSLKIPNVKFSPDAIDLLKPYDGQMVRFVADKSGAVEIVPLGSKSEGVVVAKKKVDVTVPVPDHSISKPISFDAASQHVGKTIAGPKGMVLTELRQNPALRPHVPDGFILPFGFFRRYLKEAGIEPLVDMLGKTNQANTRLVSEISRQIREAIFKNPIPEKMLGEIMKELQRLQKRTGHEAGYFFRSDTNIEDLPNFNGAGLNESVPNVKMDDKSVQDAVRKVWASAFKEKSIFWRGIALGTETVPLAEPSIVVMPTVFAESSGVIISKGGAKWKPGKGYISANWGIGSVVEAGAPVEELTLEGSTPHRFGLTSSAVKPTAKASGGLVNVPIQPGYPVLTPDQIKDLNAKAQEIEKTLGSQPKGWDIEWTVDANGEIGIVQARPNT